MKTGTRKTRKPVVIVTMPSFQTTRADALLIHEIAVRSKKLGNTRDLIQIDMDVTACHANGCPLDLEKLLNFPNFDFMHDIVGIRDHLNRQTGKLERCFLPRSSRHE